MSLAAFWASMQLGLEELGGNRAFEKSPQSCCEALANKGSPLLSRRNNRGEQGPPKNYT